MYLEVTINLMSEFTKRLDEQFHEMRWRCISLAADMDRLQRSEGGVSGMKSDPRIADLRAALVIVMSHEPNRAERLQMLFSDQTRDIPK